MSLEAILKISGLVDGALAAMDKVEQRLGGLQGMGQGLTRVGQQMSVGLTAPIVAGLGVATAQAISFESVMAGTLKALGEAPGTLGAQQIASDVRELSLELGQMPNAIAGMYTEAGKLGVLNDQMEEYVTLTNQASVAWDMTGDQAGAAISKLTNVLGYQDNQGRINIEGLNQLGDTINFLADSGATSEAAIATVLGRAGGATRQFGLSAESAAGFSTALLNLGDAPEVVGTAVSGMLPILQNATRAPAKFQTALEEIGLTATGLENSIRNNASESLIDFVERLSAAENTSGVISDLFGTGSDAAILSKAASNFEAFEKTMRSALGVEAGGMMASFANQSRTTASQLDTFRATGFILGSTIGSVMLPAVNNLLSTIQPLVERVAEFADKNPKVVTGLVAMAAAAATIGPALVAVGSGVSAFTAIAGAIAGIGAISLGPVALAIAGIAAAGILIAANWQKIVTFLQPAITAVKEFAMGMYEGFQPFISEIAPSLESIWQSLGVMFSNFGKNIGSFINMIGRIASAFFPAEEGTKTFGQTVGSTLGGIIAWIAKIIARAAQVTAAVSTVATSVFSIVTDLAGRMFRAGANIIGRLAEGIRSGIGAVNDAIGGIASRIGGFFPGSPVRFGPLTAFNNPATSPTAKLMEMAASGLRANPLNSALNSSLSPSTNSGGGSSFSAGGITVNVTVHGGSDGSQIAGSIGDELRKVLPDVLDSVMGDRKRVGYA